MHDVEQVLCHMSHAARLEANRCNASMWQICQCMSTFLGGRPGPRLRLPGVDRPLVVAAGVPPFFMLASYAITHTFVLLGMSYTRVDAIPFCLP